MGKSPSISQFSNQHLVYASFDRYPAPKGAATHIHAFITALAPRFGEVDLVTVQGPTAHVEALELNPIHDVTNGFRHTQLPAVGPSLIERAMFFRTQLRAWWQNRRADVVHVRSIFEGYPIARNKSEWCNKLVFEVNGMPSIELKYHYPKVAEDRELLRKLINQEQACLDAADLIITVSDVNADYLRRRGVTNDRLRIIPNGVDPQRFPFQQPREIDGREISILYSGTLSSWQGIDIAIDALSLVCRDRPARLTVVGSGRPQQIQRIQELASHLGVSQYVQVLDPVSQTQLAKLHHHADVILVPLTPNDRNVIQGCSPLKLLEAMSSGTPIIASNLPVVAAIARNEIDALLVRPGSAKSIKDAVLRFDSEPGLASRLSTNARQRIEQQFTWQHAQEKLLEAYATIG